MKLLLFDVDLTLINTNGAGRRSMTLAFRDLFGKTNGMSDVSFAGRTDPAIFRESVEKIGMEWSEDLLWKFKKKYLKYLATEIEDHRHGKHIEPGVETLLKKLQDRSDVTLALLTGNWRVGARLKLEHFNLWHYFEFGVFADNAEVRSELPPIAADKFEESRGFTIMPENVYIIGDTPRDVECARPFGACTIAIASGFYSYEQLRAANPNYLLHDLTDTDAFIKIVEKK